MRRIIFLCVTTLISLSGSITLAASPTATHPTSSSSAGPIVMQSVPVEKIDIQPLPPPAKPLPPPPPKSFYGLLAGAIIALLAASLAFLAFIAYRRRRK